MKSKVIIYITFLCLVGMNGYAQPASVRKADKKYERYAYIDAIKTYERIAEKGYKSVDLFQKLGNAYYFNSEFEQAAKWYDQLFQLSQDVEPEYYYRYAQSLKSTNQYDKANQMMDIFNSKLVDDLRAKNYAANKNYMDVIKSNSGRYEITDAGVNSQYSDYGSALYGNTLVFASARDTGNFSKKIHKWTNQYFTDLYSAAIIKDSTKKDSSTKQDPSAKQGTYTTQDSLGPVGKFGQKMNTKFNDATSPAFSKDGKTVYFTKNNFNDGKKGKNAERVTLIKIYKATRVEKSEEEKKKAKEKVSKKGTAPETQDEWTNITELPFNSDAYSTAHPMLSPDGKYLYFASDMPGTMGQSDLWRATIDSTGTIGKPENLGEMINTPGKETFPVITDENELYFATDGHPGLGGLDIFMARIQDDGTFKAPINIGEPANSSKDDFAYIIDTKTRKGFLTSNREGGHGFDDIYKFIETRKLICEQLLSGIVTDKQTGEILPGAKVTLLDEKFNVIGTVIADEKGYYEFEVECDTTYYVRGEKEGYETNEQKIKIPNESGKTDLPIQLEKNVIPVTVGDDLAKAFGIKEIYFDLDKWNIRPDAALELEKILDVLKQYPTMKLDIRLHTDSRASHKYNERLSDRRAKSTQDWLIKNGVSADRLTSRGYGETQLVNGCSDGVKCSEADHQLNRRSQFIITSLDK